MQGIGGEVASTAGEAGRGKRHRKKKKRKCREFRRTDPQADKNLHVILDSFTT